MSKAQTVLRASLAILAAVYIVNFFFLGFLIGPFDYDILSGYYEIAWHFWRTARELPAFNPFLCGGRTLGGDPQVPIFHPFTLLVPILGPTILVKWEMLGQLILGVYGLVGLLRYFAVPPLGQLWGVFLYISGGAVVARFLVGHATMGFYFLYPLFFLLSYRLAELPLRAGLRLRVAYWTLFLYCGLYKPDFLIYGAPPLFFEAALRGLLTRRWLVISDLALGLGFAGLGGAVFLLPAWKYFQDFPRELGVRGQLIAPYAWIANVLLPLKAIPKAFYGRSTELPHEFNLFLGPFALLYAWLGLRARTDRRSAEKWALIGFGIFSLLLGLGREDSFNPLLPSSWLRYLWPGFQSVRAPTRFWFATYVSLVVLSAQGFREPLTRHWRWAWALLGVLPLLLGAVINLGKTSVLATHTQWSTPRAYPTEIDQIRSDVDDSYRYLRQGMSAYDCDDNIEVHRSTALQKGDMLRPLSAAPAHFTARWVGWSRIAVAAEGGEPFPLALNLNHHPYWKFYGEGAQICSGFKDPLTLCATGNKVRGELVYEQPLVKAGAALTVAALSVLLLLFVLSRRSS